MSEGDIWYRLEDVMYAAPLDEFEYPIGNSRLEVKLLEYHVYRRTPKGVWLKKFPLATPRFVLNAARKRFACPTVEEARISFIARKERQAGIYRSRLRRAESAIEIVKGESIWSRVA